MGHYKNAEEVENRAGYDGGARLHAARGYTCSDGVGRVGPSVYEDDAERKKNRDGQHCVGAHFIHKVQERYVHKTRSLPYIFFISSISNSSLFILYGNPVQTYPFFMF